MKFSTEFKEIKEQLKILESGIRVIIHNQKNIQEDIEKKLNEVLAKNEHIKTKKKTGKIPK